jgi:hypothetical protein
VRDAVVWIRPTGDWLVAAGVYGAEALLPGCDGRLVVRFQRTEAVGVLHPGCVSLPRALLLNAVGVLLVGAC